MLNVKIKEKHKKDCFALRCYRDGTWSSPWGLFSQVLYLSRSGTNHTHANYRWWQVVCNDPKCPAWAIISEQEILNLMPTGEQEAK